ncbi:MAG TPA: hypothetical protein VFB28_00630 [Terriglobales bacterium]|jgi:hypothetical protein|nr:hypothetical protein [Terriglobales bacterium]
MTEKKKRQRVTAEITAAHLTELASKLKCPLTHEQAIALLNNEGHAYEMWKWMMKAGEEYIRFALQKQPKFTARPIPEDADRPRLVV